MTEYERGFTDGIKSKVSAELTPTLINVSKTMLEMLKPVLSTALENALNDNNAITETDVQPVNQWISVKDRFPDEDGWYLVCKHNRVRVAEWCKDCWYNESDLPIDDCTITYWKLLPEPPKDGDTDA